MVGVEAGAERAMALRHLAARSSSQAPGPVTDSAPGLYGAVQGHVGLATELLFGWVVAGLAAAMIVWFSASIVPTDAPSDPIVAAEQRPEIGVDLDPGHPLVVCTVFVAYTKCASEET